MKIVFFDLENTVIKHWNNPVLCYQEEIKNIGKDIFCEEYEYGIFSYALWCKENINTFINDGMKKKIEDEYDISINEKHILLVDEMCKFSEEQHHQSSGVTVNEYWKFYPKNHSFLDLCLSERYKQYNEFILFDDTVNNMKVDVGGKSIKFINPTY